MENLSPVGKAAQLVGGLAVLARMLKVSSPTVHEWKTYKRPVPAARCLDIVQLTKGEVCVQDLRPTDWHKFWPELATPTRTQAKPAKAASR